MKKKSQSSTFPGFKRGLGAGLAGLRAGGALLADSLYSKATGGDAGQSDFVKREAERFVIELGRMKGSYIKIGQLMALLGEHFLPPALVTALRNLHDATEPVPIDTLGSVLASVEHLNELEIDQQPLAAASLSQVHRAKIIASDDSLVLKIQYPHLAATVDEDFDTVVKMLQVARWLTPGRDLERWLSTLRTQLHLEMDYQREADYTSRMAIIAASDQSEYANLCVPHVYPRFSSNCVLALSYHSGFAVDHKTVQSLSLARRNALAQAMLELFFKELYVWGIMQTDPNLGNYLIAPRPRGDSGEKDTLVLLDFGSSVEFSDEFLSALGKTIAAGQRQSRDELIEGLVALGCLQSDAHADAKNSFADFCLLLLEPLRPQADLPAQYMDEKGLYRWAESQLIARVAQQARASVKNRHFASPTQEFAVIARKLMGVFTFICLLNPRFNGHTIAQTYIERWQASANASR